MQQVNNKALQIGIRAGLAVEISSFKIMFLVLIYFLEISHFVILLDHIKLI